MAKIKLHPDPTFKAKVSIPRAGEESANVVFTFKHRSKEEMERYLKAVPEMEDDFEMVMQTVIGWELADTFNDENVKALISNYIAAPQAIFDTYLAELSGNRRKN